MVAKLIAAAAIVLGVGLFLGITSPPAPGGERGVAAAGSKQARSPSIVARRGGTLFTLGPGFNAGLFGGHEVTDEGRANAGDRNGNGWATVALVAPTRICYSLIVTNIARPVGAHIHRGGPGTNGPVVVTLRAPANGRVGTSSGCVTASAAVVSAIRARHGAFYVNVHTVHFPRGAIRGQL